MAHFVANRCHTPFKEMCESLGMKCTMLDRRALENYFPEHAIQGAFGTNHRRLGPYDTTPLGWDKRKNWMVTKRMTQRILAGQI
jgi:hypothetical protein